MSMADGRLETRMSSYNLVRLPCIVTLQSALCRINEDLLAY